MNIMRPSHDTALAPSARNACSTRTWHIWSRGLGVPAIERGASWSPAARRYPASLKPFGHRDEDLAPWIASRADGHIATGHFGRGHRRRMRAAGRSDGEWSPSASRRDPARRVRCHLRDEDLTPRRGVCDSRRPSRLGTPGAAAGGGCEFDADRDHGSRRRLTVASGTPSDLSTQQDPRTACVPMRDERRIASLRRTCCA